MVGTGQKSSPITDGATADDSPHTSSVSTSHGGIRRPPPMSPPPAPFIGIMGIIGAIALLVAVSATAAPSAPPAMSPAGPEPPDIMLASAVGTEPVAPPP